MSEPTPNRDDILALACQAGLDLPAAYVDELVSAYGHVHAMLARIPNTRARADEPGHSFRPLAFLPPEG